MEITISKLQEICQQDEVFYMNDLILIAALAKNYVIGKDNDLPWPTIPEDFKRFKKLTTGHSVVMGRKTFDSIYDRLGKPLPNRTNVVLTHDENYTKEGVLTVNSVQDVLRFSQEHEKTYIIGGEQIYKLFLPFANRMELTHIDKVYQGDAFFPEFDKKKWFILDKEKHDGFSFVTYVKD